MGRGRVALEKYRQPSSRKRRHSALRYRTPAEHAELCRAWAVVAGQRLSQSLVPQIVSGQSCDLVADIGPTSHHLLPVVDTAVGYLPLGASMGPSAEGDTLCGLGSVELAGQVFGVWVHKVRMGGAESGCRGTRKVTLHP